MIERECDTCYHQHSMRCPNSFYCYSTEEKPYWTVKKNLEVKTFSIGLFDIFMIVLTQGLWIIWLLIKCRRSKK